MGFDVWVGLWGCVVFMLEFYRYCASTVDYCAVLGSILVQDVELVNNPFPKRLSPLPVDII